MEDQAAAYASWKLAVTNQEFFVSKIKEQLGQYSYTSIIICQLYGDYLS
jgi:hypothetical protein